MIKILRLLIIISLFLVNAKANNINSKLEKHLKLIDPKKNNILLYCFECEVK